MVCVNGTVSSPSVGQSPGTNPYLLSVLQVDLSLELSNGQFSLVTFVGDGVLVSPRPNDTPSSTTDQEVLPVQQYRLGAPAHRKIALPEQVRTSVQLCV